MLVKKKIFYNCRSISVALFLFSRHEQIFLYYSSLYYRDTKNFNAFLTLCCCYPTELSDTCKKKTLLLL